VVNVNIVKFDVALRNAIMNRAGGDPVRPEAASGAAERSRLKLLVHRTVAAMIKPLRRVFGGEIMARLAALDIVADSIHALHLKLDDTHLQIATLKEQLEATYARLEDVTLKVRGPIRLDDQRQAIRLADGYLCVPASDLQLVVMLTDAPPGGLEPGTREVLRRVLRPGMHMVDVGANVGLHALAAARIVGRTGRVTAIEPTPSVVECLRQTVQLNAVAAIVDIRAIAVGSERSTSRFFLHAVSGHNSLYQHGNEQGEVIDVEVETLDALLSSSERVDLVKLDVEGAELSALRGMSRTLDRNPDLVLIAEFGPSHLEAVGIAPADCSLMRSMRSAAPAGRPFLMSWSLWNPSILLSLDRTWRNGSPFDARRLAYAFQ
jgi:FkbM family methyltransferase